MIIVSFEIKTKVFDLMKVNHLQKKMKYVLVMDVYLKNYKMSEDQYKKIIYFVAKKKYNVQPLTQENFIDLYPSIQKH